MVLCSELVGRDAQVGGLTRRLDDLAAGRGGGFIALVGDAGAGKSRLLRVVADAAASRGIMVLSGRASAGGSPSPYRPLRDAFLEVFRDKPIPTCESLQGFHGHLGRLLPSAGVPAAEDSPVLVAESVVRLLAVLAEDAGCLLLLEDLHWTDPETIAVLDYLSDALDDQPVLCACTTRPAGAVGALIDRLDRTGREQVIGVGHLADDDVVRMVGVCLGMADPPVEVGDFVVAHSDGNPFLVEELLAGLVADGQLRRERGYWEAAGPLTPLVPASLKESIDRRLSMLGPTDRRVLGAAAMLGRHFDWNLLPGIAGVDGRAATDSLRAAVSEQVIAVDGDRFVFRHALTRETVLAGLLPFERRDFASRAWPAVELANPGLPGQSCELAADLAEAAGEPVAAAQRLVESARRALRNGALATAEATARRAQALAGGADEGVAIAADEVLVHTLVAAGKPADALALGRRLLDHLEKAAASKERHVELLVAIVRAALAAGDLDAAADAVTAARSAAGPDPDLAVLARLDAVAGEVALDRSELEEAERVTRRAVDEARSTDQPAVLCEALLTLGRILRVKDAPAMRACFGEAASVAVDAGLARWHLRAQQELALEEWTERGAAPLEGTRALAVRYGAHITVAVMDLSLADLHLSSFDGEGCLRHARACVDASTRFGLATEPVAQLWLAGAHGLSGDDVAMQTAIDASLAFDPDDARILADLHGRVLVSRAFVRDELDTLRSLTDTMMEYVRRAPPTTSVYPGRILWTLLCTIHDDDDHGAPARAEFHEVAERYDFPMFVHTDEIIEGVARARAGDAEGAAALVTPAHRALSTRPYGLGIFHATSMLVAQAAIRDGWGEPAHWLRLSEAFFTERRYDRIARRCRALLAEAGAPVPRRRGDTEVPQALRALGVTGREVEVLKLVMAGHTNKEIAAELVLSPKTVERHLSSLFGRVGVHDRHALADVGGSHLS